MNARDALIELYWPLERAIVPGLRYSQTVFEEALTDAVRRASHWLDLGCGRRLLPPWRGDAERSLFAQCERVVGLDYDLPSLRDNVTVPLRCRGDIALLPFPDASFDLVTANMVMEHLDDPAQEFREIHRVLRPGGRLLFHTVNANGHTVQLSRRFPDGLKRHVARFFDGRSEEDVFPTRYRVNTVDDIHRFAGEAGFDQVDIRPISTCAIFAVVPPLAIMELLWIRTVRSEQRAGLRSNLIVTLGRSI